MAGAILIARTTFRSPVNARIIRRDLTTVREGHPVHRANPENFKPFVVTFEYEEPVAATEPVAITSRSRRHVPVVDLPGDSETDEQTAEA